MKDELLKAKHFSKDFPQGHYSEKNNMLNSN